MGRLLGYTKLRDFTWQSIRVKVTLGLLLIVAPLVGLLIFSNIYAIDVVRTQVANSNTNLLTLYRDQIDVELQEVDDYLIEMIIGSELMELEISMNPRDRFFASQRIASDLSSSILRYAAIDGLFVYVPSSDNYLYAFQSRSTIEDRDYIRSRVYDMILENVSPEELNHRKWHVHKNGNETYLVRFLMKENNTIAGAWLNVQSFEPRLDLLAVGEKGAVLLTDDQGKAIINQSFVSDNRVEVKPGSSSYYITGESDRFLAVGEQSRQGEISLYAFIPEETILQHLPVLKAISILLPLGSILILLIGLIYLRKWILLPVSRLLKAMKRIQQGNMDTQIEHYPTSIEFHMMNKTFNNMISQIKDLRINVYEEQIHKQKAELQHLQLQIKPHFYINTLNILHTLAKKNDVKRIEEMSLYLIHYFRYMFQSNLSYVKLKDELAHIQNYLRIQELRFPEHFQYKIEAPEFLMRTPVPPLVIQTLVENSMKHAVTLDEPVGIHIQVEMRDVPESCVWIQVRDTGPGMKEEVIEKIEANQRIVDEEGEHIGIWNLKQRLRLLYGSRSKVSFRNAIPNGTIVEITLPFAIDEGKNK